MTTTANGYNTENIHNLAATRNDHREGQDGHNTLQNTEAQTRTGRETAPSNGKSESELRAAARRRGLTLKELADRMGASYGYLCSVSSGKRPWSPMLRERAQEVLGEVPGQGVVYRQGGLVEGESTSIRERARQRGLSMKALAGLVGVSAGYISDVSRGRRYMSPAVQARVEKALGAPVEIAPAQCANRQGEVASGQSTYLRERAREQGMILRQVADRTGLSYGYVVMVSRGHRNLSRAPRNAA